jgi:type I site-specific restriction endonuclease
VCNKDNGKTICQAYNEVLKEAKNDTIIFCHNDIHIITAGYDKIIEELFNKYP